MLQQMLIAAALIGALVAGWVGVQALVRRQSPGTGGDRDVLACGTCGEGRMCHCGFGRGHGEGDEPGVRAANPPGTGSDPSTGRCPASPTTSRGKK